MKRTIFGIVATLGWLTFLAIIIANKWNSFLSMPLNEVGDFLAGAFAPIAFLWLVIGYFQQGDELKLNTQALLAQEEEMAELVKQYARQAAASETLAEITRHSKEEEKQRMIQAAKPDIKFTGGSFGSNSANISFVNSGGCITNISIESEASFSVGITPNNIIDSKATGTVGLGFKKNEPQSGVFKIKYTDMLNKQGELRFEYDGKNGLPTPVENNS